jgi:hypothetical protein
MATVIAFIAYPSVMVIFHGRMPELKLLNVFWGTLWAVLFKAVEIIALLNDSINHHHGWSLYRSFLFNLTTFSALIIHRWKTWAAWLLSIFTIVSSFIIYDAPLPD